MADHTTAEAQWRALAAGRRYNAAWEALRSAGANVPTAKFHILHLEILEAAQQIVAAEEEIVEHAEKCLRQMQER